MVKLQEIKLRCGTDVIIDHDSKTTCKKCGKEIKWAMTKNQKAMPVVLVSLALWDTHYADCPFASSFRKKNV